MTGPHYCANDRGDRTRPRRWQRNYYVLRDLKAKLERLLATDAFPKRGRLLDFGCGNRPYEALFRTACQEYVGADLPGNPRADLQLDAGGAIPAPDASFDLVLSTQVLEHVHDPRQYLGEASRVLRPGGFLLLSTHGVWPYHPDPEDYWRWTLDGLRREFTLAGFTIVREEGVLSAITSAVQLWQDATVNRLPRVLRPVYCLLCQGFISWVEFRRRGGAQPDAAVYIFLGRKPPSAPPGC